MRNPGGRANRSILAAALAVGAAGCPKPTDPPATACGPEPMRIEIGGGHDAFEPLADGDKIQVQTGGQGLHHIWFQFRAWGMGTSFNYEATLARPDMPGVNWGHTLLAGPFAFRDVDGTCQSPTDTDTDSNAPIVILATCCAGVGGQAADLTLRVTDLGSPTKASVTDTRHLVLKFP